MPPPAEHIELMNEAAQLLKQALASVPWVTATLVVVARGRGVVPVDVEVLCQAHYDTARLLGRDIQRAHVLAAAERLGRMRDLSGPVPWVWCKLVLERVGDEVRARVEPSRVEKEDRSCSSGVFAPQPLSR